MNLGDTHLPCAPDTGVMNRLSGSITSVSNTDINTGTTALLERMALQPGRRQHHGSNNTVKSRSRVGGGGSDSDSGSNNIPAPESASGVMDKTTTNTNTHASTGNFTYRRRQRGHYHLNINNNHSHHHPSRTRKGHQGTNVQSRPSVSASTIKSAQSSEVASLSLAVNRLKALRQAKMNASANASRKASNHHARTNTNLNTKALMRVRLTPNRMAGRIHPDPIPHPSPRKHLAVTSTSAVMEHQLEHEYDRYDHEQHHEEVRTIHTTSMTKSSGGEESQSRSTTSKSLRINTDLLDHDDVEAELDLLELNDNTRVEDKDKLIALHAGAEAQTSPSSVMDFKKTLTATEVSKANVPLTSPPDLSPSDISPSTATIDNDDEDMDPDSETIMYVLSSSSRPNTANMTDISSITYQTSSRSLSNFSIPEGDNEDDEDEHYDDDNAKAHVATPAYANSELPGNNNAGASFHHDHVNANANTNAIQAKQAKNILMDKMEQMERTINELDLECNFKTSNQIQAQMQQAQRLHQLRQLLNTATVMKTTIHESASISMIGSLSATSSGDSSDNNENDDDDVLSHASLSCSSASHNSSLLSFTSDDFAENDHTHGQEDEGQGHEEDQFQNPTQAQDETQAEEPQLHLHLPVPQGPEKISTGHDYVDQDSETIGMGASNTGIGSGSGSNSSTIMMSSGTHDGIRGSGKGSGTTSNCSTIMETATMVDVVDYDDAYEEDNDLIDIVLDTLEAEAMAEAEAGQRQTIEMEEMSSSSSLSSSSKRGLFAMSSSSSQDVFQLSDNEDDDGLEKVRERNLRSASARSERSSSQKSVSWKDEDPKVHVFVPDYGAIIEMAVSLVQQYDQDRDADGDCNDGEPITNACDNNKESIRFNQSTPYQYCPTMLQRTRPLPPSILKSSLRRSSSAPASLTGDGSEGSDSGVEFDIPTLSVSPTVLPLHESQGRPDDATGTFSNSPTESNIASLPSPFFQDDGGTTINNEGGGEDHSIRHKRSDDDNDNSDTPDATITGIGSSHTLTNGGTHTKRPSSVPNSVYSNHPIDSNVDGGVKHTYRQNERTSTSDCLLTSLLCRSGNEVIHTRGSNDNCARLVYAASHVHESASTTSSRSASLSSVRSSARSSASASARSVSSTTTSRSAASSTCSESVNSLLERLRKESDRRRKKARRKRINITYCLDSKYILDSVYPSSSIYLGPGAAYSYIPTGKFTFTQPKPRRD